MKMLCPHCQAVFGAAPAPQGRLVTCPRCRDSFPAPAAFATPPSVRPRRRFVLLKVIVLLVLSFLVLRFGFERGWRDAGHRLAQSGMAEPPSPPQAPRPPARRTHRTAEELVEHFREAGLDCKAVPGSRTFAPSRATALLDVEGDGWHAAVYEFRNDTDAEELARLERKGEQPVHRNHNLVLRVLEGEQRVLPSFKEF